MDDLKKTVIALLEQHGIRRGSKSWRDYETGKFHLEELDLDSIQYHDACVIVANYVGVKLDKQSNIV
jgi:hypothetical protein